MHGIAHNGGIKNNAKRSLMWVLEKNIVRNVGTKGKVPDPVFLGHPDPDPDP